MSEDRALIAALAQSLTEHRTRWWHGERHQENCARGLWRGEYAWADGLPCSEKCARGADLLRRAEERLAETTPRQLSLEAS